MSALASALVALGCLGGLLASSAARADLPAVESDAKKAQTARAGSPVPVDGAPDHHALPEISHEPEVGIGAEGGFGTFVAAPEPAGGADVAVAAGGAAASAAAATNGAVPVPVAIKPVAQVPDARAKTLFGYASPWTPLFLAAIVVLLAFLLHRLVPKKRRRIGRATLLTACYATTFALALFMHHLGAQGWSRGLWRVAEVFEALAIIDLLSIFLFDLVLTALRIEFVDIGRDLLVAGTYVVAFIWMMHQAGVDLSSIVATSAVVTAVLGLSLQATLANVIGGIALQLDDSINVGDWLQLRDGQQGRVKAIRWRSTLLETRNWDTLVLPNAVMLGEQIQILGQKQDHPRQHREWIYFHVDYRFSPEEVCRSVDEALQLAPIVRVALDPPPTCLCIDLGQQGTIDGTITYGVRYWLTDQGIHDSTNSAVRVRIFAALKRAGIPLALPGNAVFVSHDDKEHQERKEAREIAQRVSAIEGIEMLQCLSNEERLELARRMRLAPFSRGEVITRQGAVAHWLYVLIKGEAEVRVKVPRNGQPDLEKLVTRLKSPDVFGEMGVMTGEPRTATVSAATDVECYRIDKDMFHNLVKHRPELAESISAVMARRRVELQAVRDNLGPEERKGRVAAERSRILAGIQNFFGLDGEEQD